MTLAFIQKYWWGLVIPVVAIVIGYWVTVGTPQIFSGHAPAAVIAADGINLSDIFAKLKKMQTSLEQQNFLRHYQGSTVYGTGIYRDIAQNDQGYMVVIALDNGNVNCQFDASMQDRLLLLTTGQAIAFDGVFIVTPDIGRGLYVTSCALLNLPS